MIRMKGVAKQFKRLLESLKYGEHLVISTKNSAEHGAVFTVQTRWSIEVPCPPNYQARQVVGRLDEKLDDDTMAAFLIALASDLEQRSETK